jgi:hypothetical protein
VERRRGAFRGYDSRFEKMLFPVIFFQAANYSVGIDPIALSKDEIHFIVRIFHSTACTNNFAGGNDDLAMGTTAYTAFVI